MTSQGTTKQVQSVGAFPTHEAAEQAQTKLKEAGFAADRLSIDTNVIDPNPPTRDTKAGDSAGGGAIAGTLFGALVGLLFTAVSLGGSVSDANPLAHQDWFANFGVIFIFSGVGAAAGGLLGSLSGVNVPKSNAVGDRRQLAQSYLVVLKGSDEDLQRAQAILRQQGG